MSEEWGVPAVLSDEAQSVEGEGGDGEAEAGPGQDVSGVVLVVRHPGDGDNHGVHQSHHLHRQLSETQKSWKNLIFFQEIETFIYKIIKQPSYF